MAFIIELKNTGRRAFIEAGGELDTFVPGQAKCFSSEVLASSWSKENIPHTPHKIVSYDPIKDVAGN